MSHGFNGLGRAAPQGMHCHYVAAAHMREQASYSRLLR